MEKIPLFQTAQGTDLNSMLIEPKEITTTFRYKSDATRNGYGARTAGIHKTPT